MRKDQIETAEPLPLEIAEWMGLADPPRRSSVEEDVRLQSGRRGLREQFRARLANRLAS